MGFDIGDDIAFHGGKLETLSLTKGKKQFIQKDIKKSKNYNSKSTCREGYIAIKEQVYHFTRYITSFVS